MSKTYLVKDYDTDFMEMFSDLDGAKNKVKELISEKYSDIEYEINEFSSINNKNIIGWSNINYDGEPYCQITIEEN